MRETPLEVRLLWTATLAAMIASWTHLVSWIASWEYAGASAWVIAAIGATAVDLGILASMRSLDALATRGEDASGPRRTVYMLACVSFAANVLHALDARATRIGPVPDHAGWPEPAARIAGAVLVAGVLPLIVVRLSHLLDRMTRDAAAPVTQGARRASRAKRARRRPWAGWMTHLRRGLTQATHAGAVPAMAHQAALLTQDDALLAPPVTQADDASSAAPMSRDDAARDTAVAVCDAARVAPRASRRALARSAGVSDATVRRLERDGVLAWTDSGWVAAT